MKRELNAACLTVLLLLMTSRSPAGIECKRTDPMSENKIRVLALMNSGEPDPSWEITAEHDLTVLKKSLAALRSAGKPDWPSLGWRGFQLVNEGIAGFPEEVQVFKGIIRITNGLKTDYYRDLHGLEKWLERQAREHRIRVG